MLSTDAVVRKGIAAVSHESERLRAVAHSLCVSAHRDVRCREPCPLAAQLRVSVSTRLKQHFHFSSLLRKAFFYLPQDLSGTATDAVTRGLTLSSAWRRASWSSENLEMPPSIWLALACQNALLARLDAEN